MAAFLRPRRCFFWVMAMRKSSPFLSWANMGRASGWYQQQDLDLSIFWGSKSVNGIQNLWFFFVRTLPIYWVHKVNFHMNKTSKYTYAKIFSFKYHQSIIYPNLNTTHHQFPLANSKHVFALSPNTYVICVHSNIYTYVKMNDKKLLDMDNTFLCVSVGQSKVLFHLLPLSPVFLHYCPNNQFFVVFLLLLFSVCAEGPTT